MQRAKSKGRSRKSEAGSSKREAESGKGFRVKSEALRGKRKKYEALCPFRLALSAADRVCYPVG